MKIFVLFVKIFEKKVKVLIGIHMKIWMKHNYNFCERVKSLIYIWFLSPIINGSDTNIISNLNEADNAFSSNHSLHVIYMIDNIAIWLFKTET